MYNFFIIIFHLILFFYILFNFYNCVNEIIKKPTSENKSGKIAMKKKKLPDFKNLVTTNIRKIIDTLFTNNLISLLLRKHIFYFFKKGFFKNGWIGFEIFFILHFNKKIFLFF